MVLNRNILPLYTNNYYIRMESIPEGIEEQCIVCLDDNEETSEKLILYSAISHTRNCACKYYIHRRCYEEWKSTNDVCVVCRTPNKVESEVTDVSSIIIEHSQHTTGNDDDMNEYSEDSSDDDIYRYSEDNMRNLCRYHVTLISVRICFMILLIILVGLTTEMNWL